MKNAVERMGCWLTAIMFIALSATQWIAEIDGLSRVLGWSRFASVVVSLATGWIPVLGTAAGIWGAHAAWGWGWLPAFALFFLGGIVVWLPYSLIQAAPKVAASSHEEAQTVINAYGAAVEKHAASGAIVSDVSLLPLPKDAMREVLLTLIRHMPAGPEREHLKTGYILLSDFQPGVGPNGIKLDLQAGGEDIRASAAHIAAQGGVVMDWMTKRNIEGARLLKDLTDAGL